jgi:hypothetical protein
MHTYIRPLVVERFGFRAIRVHSRAQAATRMLVLGERACYRLLPGGGPTASSALI